LSIRWLKVSPWLASAFSELPIPQYSAYFQSVLRLVGPAIPMRTGTAGASCGKRLMRARIGLASSAN